MPTQVILALDTSTSQGGVAIVEGRPADASTYSVLSRQVWKREKSHSEFLTPTIESVVADAGVELKDIDALAIGQGPGSFTGIRIGVNVARSLAYALKKPIFAFDTLEILANGVRRKDLPVLALVNAHKNLLFSAIYDWRSTPFPHRSPSALQGEAEGQWEPRSPIRAMTVEEITGLVQEPILCVGDGYLEYENFFPIELKRSLVRDIRENGLSFDDPLPEVLGQLALAQSMSRPPLDWNVLQALYIRASGAEENLETKQG